MTPEDRKEHIRVIQRHLCNFGKGGKFWEGRADTEYPMERFEEVMGYTPREAMLAALGHLRRHVAILEAKP